MISDFFVKRTLPWGVVLALLLVTTGCFFDLSRDKDFKSWYFGKPGLAGALGEENCDPYADRIHGERHPYYLHFRTLEVFYQPQGGTRYPERSTAAGSVDEGGRTAYACEIIAEGRETFPFKAVDAGLVDVVIPYRSAGDTLEEASPQYETGSYAGSVASNTGIAAVMKAPVYVVHDILKTLYIPVAGTYFLFKSDEEPETGEEAVIMVEPETRPSEEAPADLTAERETDTVAADAVDSGPSPLTAAEPDTTEIASGEIESAPVDPTPLDSGEDGATVPPQTDETDRNEEQTLYAVTDEENRSGEAPSDTKGIADTTAPHAEPADSLEPDPAGDPAPLSPSASLPDTVEPPATGAEDDAALASASALPAPATETDASAPDTLVDAKEPLPLESRPESSDATAEAPIQEENLMDSADAPADAVEAAEDGQVSPSKEQAAMMAAAPAAPEPPADAAQPLAPVDETVSAPMADSASPKDMASVTESQASSAAESIPPVQLEEVDVSAGELKKQVAFLGFISRAATVNPELKTFFEDRLWPALIDECSANIHLLQKGDARFPDALNQLSRDQFGRLNSFELTTLARFNGVNAVVTGTVLDIGLSNEIDGILWYKEPEGTLRVAILVEVYDVETGTKLLDKTLVHQEEVDELSPGSDGQLRQEDMVSVQVALGAMAADISELVCDALDDQPWRGYVTGIEGARITLSAGADTGLVPGNILAVYNTQIIEGLNNQQFFLTGERVGRLQIIRVHPDGSEATLIEGAHLKDFSLVIPE